MVIVEVLVFVLGSRLTGTDYIIKMNLPPILTKSGHPVTIYDNVTNQGLLYLIQFCVPAISIKQTVPEMSLELLIIGTVILFLNIYFKE